MFVHDVKSEKGEKNTELTEHVNFLTYNLACLPPIFGMQYNKSILDPNLVRAKKFVDHVIQSSFDIIALQEVWDIAVANYLVEELKERYPHYVKGVNGNYQGYVIQLLRSGLMIFSKYPIVDVYTHCFGNHMFGEESFSYKGVIAIKARKDATHFITVYNTHLHAYGAVFNRFSTWYGGTSHARRDEQMRMIAQHMESWAKQSPRDSGLIHAKTFLMGDLNVSLNSERAALSVSSGSAKHNLLRNQIRYLGQYQLLSQFEFQIPNNYARKEAMTKLAIEADMFTGTDNFGNPSRQAPNKIFDALFMSKEGNPGVFVTRIVAFDEKSQKPLSDHFGSSGTYTSYPVKQAQKRPSPSDYLHVVRERLPTSFCAKLCGSVPRYHTRYMLYPEPMAKELTMEEKKADMNERSARKSLQNSQ